MILQNILSHSFTLGLKPPTENRGTPLFPPPQKKQKTKTFDANPPFFG